MKEFLPVTISLHLAVCITQSAGSRNSNRSQRETTSMSNCLHKPFTAEMRASKGHLEFSTPKISPFT